MFNFSSIVIVAPGAALGGVRFACTALVVARAGTLAAPLATLGINVVGSLLIGVVVGVVQSGPELSPLWRLFFTTGILGGFTTFSTSSLEALGLGSSNVQLAAAYVLGSVGLGLASAYVGLALGRAL